MVGELRTPEDVVNDWLRESGGEVRFLCKPNYYASGMDEWYAEVEWRRARTRFQIEVGPVRDIDMAYVRIRERLAAAGETLGLLTEAG